MCDDDKGVAGRIQERFAGSTSTRARFAASEGITTSPAKISFGVYGLLSGPHERGRNKKVADVFIAVVRIHILLVRMLEYWKNDRYVQTGVRTQLLIINKINSKLRDECRQH